MIAYVVSGRAPSGITAPLLQRIATASARVRGLPKNGVISLRFVSPAEIQRLNRTCRGKNRPTDVLSFSLTEGERFPSFQGSTEPTEIGDLMICTSIARSEARRRAMDPKEEIVRLIAHGTLHLAGHDHATQADEERMFKRQEDIVEKVLP